MSKNNETANTDDTEKSFMEETNLENIEVTQEKTVALVSQMEAQSFITKIKETHKNMNEQEIFIGVCIICQKGGTAKKASEEIYSILNNKKLSLSDCRKALETRKLRFTMRQFVRTYATRIHDLSSHYSIPGDLYKKLSRIHNDLDISDSFGLSNFKMDNKDCPAQLRDLLFQHYNSLFQKE